MKKMSSLEDQDLLVKAIQRSQHCQRNFDLSQEIPPEHVDILKVAATQCPSKQNVAHYKLHYITDRSLIEKIHNLTPTEKVHDLSQMTTNSQVLANLLIVFEKYLDISSPNDQYRNDETTKIALGEDESGKAFSILERDANVAVGIAAGYLNLVSSLLGYRSGCCQCFDQEGIKNLLGLDDVPLLLMGIGFHDPSRDRTLHATDNTYFFPRRPKQEIPVKFWTGNQNNNLKIAP